MNHYFADLSNNNAGPFDFRIYRQRGGHRLLGLKATEGLHFTDPTHTARAVAAHAQKLAVAHYHFAHPADPAAAQAEAFWAQVEPVHGRKDYCVIDIEIDQGLTPRQIVAWVRDFRAAFRKVSGHDLVGYSGEAFLEWLGADAGISRWWVAAYGPRKPKVSFLRSIWAWQFTDGKDGPKPHETAGIGPSDVSTLNTASALWLRRP